MIFLARCVPRARRPLGPGGERTTVWGMDDDAIRILVTRLARPHPSGGTVVERAAVMAEGTHAPAVLAWIVAHGGTPEAAVARASTRHGLHGARVEKSGTSEARNPARYVLPAGALD